MNGSIPRDEVSTLPGPWTFTVACWVKMNGASGLLFEVHESVYCAVAPGETFTVPPEFALQEATLLQTVLFTAGPVIVHDVTVFGWQVHLSWEVCGGTTVVGVAWSVHPGTTVNVVVALRPAEEQAMM